MLGEALLVTPVLQKSTTQGSKIFLRHLCAQNCEIGLPGGLMHIMIGTSYSHWVPTSPFPSVLKAGKNHLKEEITCRPEVYHSRQDLLAAFLRSEL